jgi:hypothetical protein
VEHTWGVQHISLCMRTGYIVVHHDAPGVYHLGADRDRGLLTPEGVPAALPPRTWVVTAAGGWELEGDRDRPRTLGMLGGENAAAGTVRTPYLQRQCM